MKKFLLFAVVAAAIGIAVSSMFNRSMPQYDPHYEVSYSDFIEDVRNGVVTEVMVDGNYVDGKRNNGTRFSTYNPNDMRMIDELLEYGVKIKVEKPQPPSTLMSILISWAPTLLLIAVLVYFMRKQAMMAGGRDGQMGFGKSRAKLMEEDQVKIRFKDVAGCEEAKQDVVEMVDFLRDPGKYEVLGGKIPRGVLMVGPPGTGKTLLAKAIAGEAGVPFFSISGSDFVEMFVGVGASRVRDMFTEAKKRAPCIIFIDEIDAVGRQRGGAGMGGDIGQDLGRAIREDRDREERVEDIGRRDRAAEREHGRPGEPVAPYG
mgnify:CR=1 FL=1